MSNLSITTNIEKPKISRINEINKLLSQGENIISYLTDGHSKMTSVEDEMISYDLRAGKDLAKYLKDPSMYKSVAEKIAHYIIETGCNSGKLFECGSGEGILLSEICDRDDCKFLWARGCDISWSRTAYAKKTSLLKEKRNSIDLDFIVGNFFHLPLKDNSIDVLYTMQGIYGMGGNEEILLKELYRVVSGYLILIEPCYELADSISKERMERLGYVKNLRSTAEKLGYEIVKYEKFGLDSNPLNPAAVLIIKKNVVNENEDALCCPYTYSDLIQIGNVYYCEESKLSYPILNGVACITRENAVVTSQIKRIHEIDKNQFL